MNALCVGCGRYSEGLMDYADDPVEMDGTYSNGKFVCNSCFAFLVDLGFDVGPPESLQEYAKTLVRPLNP